MKQTIKKPGLRTAEGEPGLPKAVFRYLVIAAFCLIFSRIYGLFSHGIRSPWMTYLAAWPLLAGALPAALMQTAGKEQDPEKADTGEAEKTGLPDRRALLTDLHPFGVAALTAASLLKGILEIAGTDSPYPDILLAAGALMTVCGAAAGFLQKRQNQR